MKLLVDTNIVIPAEPASAADVSPLTPAALRLQQLAQTARATLCVHPRQQDDIAGDRNLGRRELRLQLLSRYAMLVAPPSIQPELATAISPSSTRPHDEIDDLLLAAVFGHAVNYLVTEDKGIHQRARRANVHHRVLFLSDAIAVLENLFDRAPTPPPTVDSLVAHQLDAEDPIFDSLRSDYRPVFDEWLAKCKLAGRQCWVVRADEAYLAVAIVKAEESPPRGATGKVLKLCTFKVSDRAYGRRYGELLLKTIFEFARGNRYDDMFVTAFDKQEELLQLFSAFGFERLADRTILGEQILLKHLTPPSLTSVRGLEFNIAYGPYNVDWDQPAAVIPIQPQYHQMLFPEQDKQPRFNVEGQPFGNALRKAYLCNSTLRGLPRGSVIWFYRSHDDRGIVACGVVEDVMRSSDPDIVTQFVGRRTVYSYAEIRGLAQREILAITFRQARLMSPPIRLGELQMVGVLKGPPQSIVRLGPGEAKWLAQRIQ